MSENRASLEIIAPSVEEALAKGLEELGLPEQAVEVEVLDPGSRGLFGIGARQARVRLTIKSQPSEPAPAAPAPTAPQPAAGKAAPYAAAQEAEPEEAPSQLFEVEEAGEAEELVELAAGEEEVLQIAEETVRDLLEKMKVQAQVHAHYGEPDESRSRPPVMVEVNGNDLSILIGPRAETLNALQYIAGLIVGKELGRSISLVVDVEGYRARREKQIRQLARRMADQAVKTGRRQVLEPMPANERRLVHIELRDHPQVTTQSVGEEPRRKVTIIPEK